ncbi:universal stress protein UspA [Sporocytophaga myxococcoides]|uniref:Universal stress protein UspA n=1 Tax=Sporocytophaga myxococcoides TaxID=153721 RepID=A0A098LKZ0_9BACT|nr:universal stress protein [Sporocytophaga myxococcoides]GAL87047.1 universal stress protein UspA [Sporocytophaga myxococcoides]
MERILVPVDFSVYSQKALEAAAYIALQKKCEVKLLHVVQQVYVPKIGSFGDPLFEDELQMDYQARIMEVKQRLLKGFVDRLKSKGIKSSGIIVQGKVSKEVLLHAADEEIDLIIVGKKGESDIEEVLFGSTTLKLIRKAAVPLLILKNTEVPFKVETIVFASDFEEPVHKIVGKVKSMAEAFKANLHFLKVNTPSNSISEAKIQKTLDEIRDDFKLENNPIHLVSDKTEEEGILHFTKQVNADVVCLVSHEKKGLKRIFSDSISENIVKESDCAIVIYKLRKEMSAGKAAVKQERKMSIKDRQRYREDL